MCYHITAHWDIEKGVITFQPIWTSKYVPSHFSPLGH